MNKTRLTLLGTAALAVVASAAGATFALFNASVDPEETEFTAGTVELALRDGKDGELISSPYFTLADMAPGDTLSKEIWISNEGTLDFRYQADLIKSTDGGELDDNLDVIVDYWNGSTWVYAGEVDFNAAVAPGGYLPTPGVDLPKGGKHGFRLTFELPTNTENEAQGDSVTFAFSVLATQKKNNS